MFRKIVSMLLAIVIVTSTFTTMITTVSAEDNNTYTTDVTNDVITIDGENSFGNMLSAKLDGAMSLTTDVSDYAITGLEISGQTATVEYMALADCTILVALYDDKTNQMIASGRAVALCGAEKVEIEIETDEMPQYFVAKAYMLDSSNNPLAKSFSTDLYTQAIQEVKALKASDFDESRVINFDDSDETNFAVYSENTKVVEYEENFNIPTTVDDENGIYVFSNATEEFASLKQGDVLSYEYSEDNIIIIKVDTVTVDGDTVSITESKAELEDVFNYVKIEAVQDTSDCKVDMSKADEDVKLASDMSVSAPIPGLVRAVQGDVTIKPEDGLKYQLLDDDSSDSNFSVTGDISFAIQAKIKFYISFEKTYVDFSLNYGVDFSVTLAVKTKEKIIKELGSLGFTPVPGVIIALTPKIVFEAEASIKLSLKYEGKIGFSVSGRNVNNTSKAPQTSSQVKAKGRLFLGVMLEPSVSVISKKIFKFAFDATCGLYIEAENKDPDENHLCTLCFKGEIGAELAVGADIELFTKELGRLEAKVKIALFNFYYSVDYNDVGIGICPYDAGQTEPTESTLPTDATSSTTPTEDTSSTSPTEDTDVTEPDSGSTVLYSGSAGANSTWRIWDNGLLEITGTGQMVDNNIYTYSPWYKHRGLIKNVDIGVGITSIRAYAFYECVNLTYVKIPNTVESIADYAFWKCTNLNNVRVPEGVISMGTGVFSDCTSLTDVVISDTVTLINGYTFANCVNLQNIVIPDSVTSMGNHMFYNCTKLTDVKISNNVKELGGTFINCTSLKSVVIPEGVTHIGSVFNWCESLTDVTLPDSLIWMDNVFSACPNLSDITIPENVVHIGRDTFNSCTSLTSINIPDSVVHIGEAAFLNCTSLKSVVIPEGVLQIGDSAFRYCYNLESVEIPSSLTDIGEFVFNDTAYYNNESNWDGDVLYINNYLIKANTTLSGTYNINENTIIIASGAFRDCTNLTNVVISDNVTYINSSAFSGCNKLTDIIIPDNVTEIHFAAFEKCTALKSIILSENLKDVNSTVFSECTNLTKITIPGSVRCISTLAFYKCNRLSDVIISDGVEILLSSSFEGCTSLSKITIPESVTHISDNVFKDCTSLRDVYIYGNPVVYDTSFPAKAKLHYVENSTNSVSSLYLTSTLLASSTSKIVNFSNLVAGEDYIIAVVKNESCDDLLSADNLLYIDQQIADDNGSVVLSYIPRENVENYVTLIFGAKKSITDAQVIARMGADSQIVEYIVMLNSQVLTENTDYELVVNSDNSTVTVTGINRFKDCITTEAETFFTGDVNRDGVVDISDATYIMKCSVGLKSCGEAQKIIADVDGDNVMNVIDATAIQKYIVGFVL